MATGKRIRFSELLELHVNNVISRKFTRKDPKDQVELTPDLMREIRDAILEAIGNVFAKSNHKLTPEAVSWLSNKFFKAVQINSNQTMSDLVVINEYKLSQLPYHDVELLRNLFNETALEEELEEEYRRRSQS